MQHGAQEIAEDGRSVMGRLNPERPNPRMRGFSDNTPTRLNQGRCRDALLTARARGCMVTALLAWATPGKNDRDEDGLIVRRARRPALQRWSADAAFP